MSSLMPAGRALLEVRNLVKHFPVHGGFLSREVANVQAVNGVSFSVAPGDWRRRWCLAMRSNSV